MINKSGNYLISVVTVSYNAVNDLEQTILSIINQTYSCIEYIIIDGGSTDGTIDLIKKYENKISYWISEPDKGIYDAMNKGIDRATGDWIININSGDLLLNIPVAELYKAYEDGFDALCGAIISEKEIIQHPYFDNRILISNTLPHQGLFYRKSKLYSRYNLSYKIFADYAYNIGMYKQKQKLFLSKEIISFHSKNGISNNPNSSKELLKVIYENSGILVFLVSYIRFKFRGLYKRLINLNN